MKLTFLIIALSNIAKYLKKNSVESEFVWIKPDGVMILEWRLFLRKEEDLTSERLNRRSHYTQHQSAFVQTQNMQPEDTDSS